MWTVGQTDGQRDINDGANIRFISFASLLGYNLISCAIPPVKCIVAKTMAVFRAVHDMFLNPGANTL